MNKLFGFGKETWQRYENGAKPKKSHRLMVFMALDPINMAKLISFLGATEDFSKTEEKLMEQAWQRAEEANNAIGFKLQASRTNLAKEWMEEQVWKRHESQVTEQTDLPAAE